MRRDRCVLPELHLLDVLRGDVLGPEHDLDVDDLRVCVGLRIPK